MASKLPKHLRQRANTPRPVAAQAAGGFFDEAFLNSYKPFLWIFLAGFFLYARTGFFNFSYLDDQELIINAFNFISHPSNILNFFKEDVFHTASGGAYYRPLLTISFMTDALWGGTNPGAYHFTNVLLHALAACLLFRTLAKLNFNRAQSFFYTLFFTVHPVLTQAVAWIPGRNDSLLTIFALLSFISFLSFLEERKRTQLAAHLLFLLLALFTKENAVCLCALCLFFLVFIDKKAPAAGRGGPLFAGWAAVVSIWFFARSAVLKTAIANSGFNVVGALIDNSPAVFSYIGKIFFPFNLGTLPVLKDLPLSYGLVAAGLTGYLLYVSRTKRANYIVFGVLWFLLFLLPSFIQSTFSIPNFSEHRIYLPLIGFIFLLLEADIPGLLRLSGRAAAALGAGVLLLLSLLTFSYCGSFSDKISFWKKAVESSPSHAFSYNNLGSMYYLDGVAPGRTDAERLLDLANAEKFWKSAVSINPLERRVNCNLGLLYMNRGELNKAQEYFLKEIAFNPDYDIVHFNSGILYYQAGYFGKAAESWEKTLKLNPNYATAYLNLAYLHYQRNEEGKAKVYIQEMLRRGFAVPPGILSRISAN